MYLTDTDTGVKYCRVVWRSLDTPVNMSPLCTGVYSVEVYDIERDGSVSSVPALAEEIVTVFGPTITRGSLPTISSCVYGLSTLLPVDPGSSQYSQVCTGYGTSTLIIYNVLF